MKDEFVANPTTAEERRGRVQQMIELARHESVPQRAIEWYEQGLALIGEGTDNRLVADILRWMGTVHRESGNSVEAEVLYTKSLRAAERGDAPGPQAHALNCLALVAQRRAQTEVAGGFYRRASRLAEKVMDHRLIGMIQQNLGVMASIRGDLDGALISYADSLDAFELSGDEEGMSWVLNNLAIVHTSLGNLEKAADALDQGLTLVRRRSDLHMESLFLVNQAALAIKTGDCGVAERTLEEAMAIADLRNDRVRQAEVSKLKGVLARESGNGEEAVRLLDLAHDLAVETGDTLLAAEVMRELGDTWRDLGYHDRAVALWERARCFFESWGQWWMP